MLSQEDGGNRNRSASATTATEFLPFDSSPEIRKAHRLPAGQRCAEAKETTDVLCSALPAEAPHNAALYP
jgi:hypothetical protein